jgi:hypothetical protein
MKAMIFQNLVDMYGNIPYSDALKGLNSIAPKFDDQKAVYEDLIKLLDTAITYQSKCVRSECHWF